MYVCVYVYVYTYTYIHSFFPAFSHSFLQSFFFFFSIDLSYGGSVLLEGASLRVAYARRYGVAGRNGVGTLYLACAYCYISSVRILLYI
jgi:hypothetical protein